MASSSRRSFLKMLGVAGTSIIPTANGGQAISGMLAPHRPQSSVSTKGTVTDYTGNPVSDAVISIFDIDSTKLVAKTTTDSKGTYSLNQTFGEVLVIVTDGEWFDTAHVTDLSGTSDILLAEQLLKSPTVARTTESEPLGVVSVWRSFYQNQHRVQTIHIEIANTNPVDGSPIYDIGSSAYDLESGAFTVSFPENDISVDYGDVDNVDLPGTPTVTTVHTPYATTPPVERFHPLNPNTPTLPVFGASSHLSSWQTVSKVGQSDEINQGLGLILGELPVISKLSTIGDLLQFSFGDPASKQATLGNPNVLETNPNDEESVVLGWESSNSTPSYGEAAVTFSLPVEFSYPGATFKLGAEWQLPSWSGFGDGNGTYAETIDIAPLSLVPVVGENAPTDPDNDGLYEDVDGDGKITAQDATDLARHLDDPIVTHNSGPFDFNGNGRIDYDDVVELYQETT